VTYPFLKGHGTENDFVLLPDHDGSIHGELSSARVVALCDRRAGLGGDGVIRVVRSAAVGGPTDAEWFMDYRNADGSLAEMCGNGIRLLARHLVDEGLVAGFSGDAGVFSIASRAGVHALTVERDQITVDLGPPMLLGDTKVAVDGYAWPARHVSMGNPHAVAFVEDLADAGSLRREPDFDRAVYPDGVNVEFVVRRGARHVAMRVHERGSGETRSCGTGAAAVMVAAATADGAPRDTTYRVDVPGGTLSVTWTAGDRVLLTGPAVVVARGTTDL
jgi:diaminopimelate epimerase